MVSDQPRDVPSTRSLFLRAAVAAGIALAYGLGVYVLLETIRPQSGVVSGAFLLVQPAAICAFLAYMTDLRGSRRLIRYVMVPIWTLLVVVLVSVFVLREGVVCVMILSPLWILSGMFGSLLTLRFRRVVTDGKLFCSAVLALPLLAIQIEPSLMVPRDDYVVTRSIVVAASPQQIWPLLRGIPDVRPDEGRWNVSQDIVGVPRPLSARLFGQGIGAERAANWGQHIEFKERIIEWRENQRIGWRFIFDGSQGWEFTDRHLMPDSPYFRVTTGGYTLTSLDHRHTLVTLETRYWIATPVNAYSSLWGELFLGDLENNLLALVKGRAER
jgi:hypothetical protein